jgi:hypothetical protein
MNFLRSPANGQVRLSSVGLMALEFETVDELHFMEMLDTPEGYVGRCPFLIMMF